VILVVEDIHSSANRGDDDTDWSSDACASDVDEALTILRSPQHIDALFTDIYLKTAVLGGATWAPGNRASAEFACALHHRNSVTDKMKALLPKGTLPS